MNSISTHLITTFSPTDTQKVAADLSRELQGGDVVELKSDLGGGKTTFAQGILSARSYQGRVTSPTFTLSNIYALPDGLEVHHYDLYRLDEPGVIGHVLHDSLQDPVVITLIEWAGIAQAELPQDRLIIEIKTMGDQERQLSLTAAGPRSKQLVQGLRG